MPRIKAFIWRLGKRALPTKEWWASRDFNVQGGCYLCRHDQDTFCYPYMMNAIFQVAPACLLPAIDDGSWFDAFYYWSKKTHPPSCNIFW